MKVIISFKEACKMKGVSTSTARRQVITGDFPQPVRIGPNRIGIYLDEIIKHIDSLPRGFCTAPTEANNARRKK